MLNIRSNLGFLQCSSFTNTKMQGDFSILDRKSEENGVAEAASPFNENVGFMAYNALAGGMLTGKYMDVPAAFDDPNKARGMIHGKHLK